MTQSALCVLVVDADEATRALYQRTLSRKWRVIVCASEDEATAILSRAQVDALVVEPATLNDADWSFLLRLRARNQRNGTNVPVVICSTLDQRRQGMEMGAAAYLIKPVSPREVQAILETTLGAGDVEVAGVATAEVVPDAAAAEDTAETPAGSHLEKRNS